MDPEVSRAIIANDPEIIFSAETPPIKKPDREMLIREILRRFESGELEDEHAVRQTRVNLLDLNLAAELRRYLVDQSYRISVRRVAVVLAERAEQKALQKQLLTIAFDSSEVCDLRAAAVVAVGVIGNERGITSLKTLLRDDQANDPDDEIKGAVLTAMWPRYLTAAEVFGALSPPKRRNYFGRYQHFLSADIACSLKQEDIAIALSWTDQREGYVYPNVDPLDAVAVAVLKAAIGFYAEPGISEKLAGILAKRARFCGIDSSTRVALYERDAARRAIGLAAIKKEADQQSTYSASLDLLRTNDIGFLMAELERSTQSEFKDRLCATIGQLLRRTEPASVEALQQVVSLMRTDSTFATFVAPALAPIQLDSPEAQMLRGYTERVKLQTKTRQVVSSPVPEIDDLLESRTAGSKEIFFDICFRLSQPQANWKTDDGVVPPGWLQLTTVAQVQIIDAADTYLRECRAPKSAWIFNNELPLAVIFGHWAFRLLLQEGKSRFDSLPERAWQEWILSAFGHPFRAVLPDTQEAMILKTARCKAPREFIQAVSLFIEEQDRSIGTTHIIDRLSCTWDIGIAECLRSKLSEHRLTTQTFDLILGRLIDASDQETIVIAVGYVQRAQYMGGQELIRAALCAIHLLRGGVVTETDSVWTAINEDERFAASFFDILASGAHGSAGSRLIENTSENRLADMYLLLARREPEGAPLHDGTLVTPKRARMIFENQILSHLVGRGTSIACDEIRRIAAALPERNFKPYIKNAEEIWLRTAWEPLTPDALLEAFDKAASSTGVDNNPSVQPQPHRPSRKTGRSSARYTSIDKILYEIARTKPASHKDVFAFLDGRASVPNAEPFRASRGWLLGFGRDQGAASAWLSKRWATLGLPPFPRGPK